MPLRRDPSLIPLSHDHHHGLVRVFRIREALQGRGDVAAEAAMTRAFFERELVPHFRAEEEVLFPAMAAVASKADPLVRRLQDEHRQFERLVPELETGATALEAFAELLERHIRAEERELFVRYQAVVPDAQRPRIEADLRRILNRPDDQGPGCQR